MHSYRPLVCGPRRSRDVALARLVAHLRTPLYRNGYALVLSSATTSVLGVAYWILAARTYTPDVVGLNAAAISAMMFLAGVSQLNLMSALLRFIPGAGRATGRFVVSAYLISVSVVAVSSLIFLRGLDTWAPTLSFLGSSPVVVVWFTLATMAWCIFVLQDSVLTGLRQAKWVPVENAAFSLAKIVLLVGFAKALPHYGVLASWMIAMALTLLPVNGLILRRLIPKHVAAAHGDVAPRPGTGRQVCHRRLSRRTVLAGVDHVPAPHGDATGRSHGERLFFPVLANGDHALCREPQRGLGAHRRSCD